MVATLLDHFKDSAALAETPLGATDIDWPSLGIDRKYIIFMTGRCGSTWLAHILADTGLIGKADEFFSEEFAEHFCRKYHVSTFRDYLPKIVSTYKGTRYFGFEVNPLRYVALSTIMNLSEIFRESDTTIFWMTRSDILSQAYSFAAAKQTGRWHVLSDGPNIVQPTNEHGTEITDRVLWVEIFLILEQESYMKREFRKLGIKPIALTYEELLSDKISTVTMIMTALGIASADIAAFTPTIEDRTKQFRYETKHKVMGEFFERNWRLIEPILQSRDSPDLDAIRTSLKESRGINVGPVRQLPGP